MKNPHLAPLEFLGLVRVYVTLLGDASRAEAEAHSLRIRSLEPQVAVLRSRLNLPAATKELPEFYRRLECDRGFAAVALSLHLLIQLSVSWETFEAIGKRLNTTDPESIFPVLLEEGPASQINNN